GDWTRMAYEWLIDAAAHGLRYREMFFTPSRHMAAAQDLGEIVAGLTEGIDSAEAATRARCMLFADVDRAFGAGRGRGLIERCGPARDDQHGRSGDDRSRSRGGVPAGGRGVLPRHRAARPHRARRHRIHLARRVRPPAASPRVRGGTGRASLTGDVCLTFSET